jgi:hypothetical protein
MSLQFDFYREVGTNLELGACIHYYDEYGQSLFLDGTEIATQIAFVDEGQWENADYSDDISIVDYGYNNMRFDHPSNGMFYGIATDGAEVWLLRYVYKANISKIVKQGNWREQVDNQIKQQNLKIKNIDRDLFIDDYSLFNPGHRLSTRFFIGNSEPYLIGTTYLDDFNFDAYSETVSLSSRNNLGFFLKNQTFDELNSFAGARINVYEEILIQAGITSYRIQNTDDVITVEFEPNTSILDGLNSHLEELNWRLVELPNQMVIIGDDDFIKDYKPQGTYVFNGDTEVFMRQSKKNSDGTFKRVGVLRADGEAVYREVDNWQFWNIGDRKTKYYNVDEETSIEDMEQLAERVANELKYVGIGEQFSGMIRPQIEVGDISSIFYEGDLEATNLGLITEISHTFGEQGFRTDFSVDSGGEVNEIGEFVFTRARSLDGLNRKQRILDFMQITADKRISGFNVSSATTSTTTLIETVSTAPVSVIRII